MREIKFRAWSKTAKVMHPKWEVLSNEGGEYILMQFTGLLDKNGKEIYEGDIIETPYYTMGHRNGEVRKVVEFKDGMFGVNGDNSYSFIELKGLFVGVESSKKYIPNLGERFDEFEPTFEIIGNIHENKELLT